MNKILIAGGSGFVGKRLTDYFVKNGYSINILSRQKISSSNENVKYFQWDIEKKMIDKKAFDGVEIIFNLTGANIGEKRWSDHRKKEILDSRVKSLRLLYQYVSENDFKIKTLISSSAVGYYGAVTTDKIFDETTESGFDFLGTTCKKWEEAALKFKEVGVRTVILRKGVVIGKEGGIYQKLSPLAKLGINTSLGNGKQYLPWIDVRDLVHIYDFMISKPELHGIYNAVSSEHITMNDFSKGLLESFGKKSFLPNPPKFLIQLVLGEMSAMLLEGSRVSNKKLVGAGFEFEFDSLEKALG